MAFYGWLVPAAVLDTGKFAALEIFNDISVWVFGFFNNIYFLLI